MTKHRALAGDQSYAVDTGWSDILMICRKCSRKLDGGYGPDGSDSLKRAVRAALRATGQRGRVGLMEVACLGICPKRAVTTVRASQPGVMRIVPVGTAAAGLLG